MVKVYAITNVPLFRALCVAGLKEVKILSDTFSSPSPSAIASVATLWSYFAVFGRHPLQREHSRRLVVVNRKPHVRPIRTSIPETSTSKVPKIVTSSFLIHILEPRDLFRRERHSRRFETDSS